MIIFKAECETRKGTAPKKYNNENQDAFAFENKDGLCCMCLADGAGSKKYSAVGAQWLVKDLCKFMMEESDKIFSANEDQIQKMIMDRIKHSLDKTMHIQNVEMYELSSTFIGVLTDGVQFIIAHLGDGCVTGTREGVFNVLSFPENGTSRQATALTTMLSAERHLRIQKGSCENVTDLWLMTDGAQYGGIFGENYGLGGEKLSMSMIRQRLENGTSDDATYGYITWTIDK